MARPLGLPIGSVRAICLLGLGSRAILDLRADQGVAPWLGAALIVCGASYFAGRAARRGSLDLPRNGAPEAPRRREPLGLPAGTVRLIFLALVGYGAWVWLKQRPLPEGSMGPALVIGSFFTGVLVRWFLTQVRRPEDTSTLAFEHVLALVSLVAVGGLIAMAASGRAAADAGWTQPALAAAATFYFGSR